MLLGNGFCIGTMTASIIFPKAASYLVRRFVASTSEVRRLVIAMDVWMLLPVSRGVAQSVA
jgi:hypothetical protein